MTVTLDGTTLEGHRLKREVPVCGPAAFIVLKALAMAGRDKPKHDYDPVYVIRKYEGAPESIAKALARHAATHPALVREALEKLSADFESPEHWGPQYVAEFDGLTGEEADQAAGDAHGHVDELLKACRRSELL